MYRALGSTIKIRARKKTHGPGIEGSRIIEFGLAQTKIERVQDEVLLCSFCHLRVKYPETDLGVML